MNNQFTLISIFLLIKNVQGLFFSKELTLEEGICIFVCVCVCVCVWVHALVTQSYLNLCDPMNCNLPGSSVNGIFQARILEWVDIPFLSQGLNLGLLHCRKILYHLSHEGSPEEVIVFLKFLWDRWVRMNNAHFRDSWDPVVLKDQLQII